MLRAQRAEATASLLRIADGAGEILPANNTYAAQLVGAAPAGLGLPTTSDNRKYDLAIQAGAGPNGFIAQATAAAGQGQTDDTKCVLFTINNSGVRQALDSGGADKTLECWR